MKIFVAGSYNYEFYDDACAVALEEANCSVVRFDWQKYYGRGVLKKIQQRLLLGPGISLLNKEMLAAIKKESPNVVFITRGVPVFPSTLVAIKRIGNPLLVANNNDDPFGKEKGKYLWRNFVKGIPFYDVHFVFRELNKSEYFEHNAKRVEVLMPYYIPSLHYPIELTQEEEESFKSDVVFVGHAKEDGRINYLKSLVDAGVKVKIYGYYWDRLARKQKWIDKIASPPVWGKEYTKVLKSAKMALVFYNKGNRDTYTTRSFEIPAIGTCMVSEKTKEMTDMYKEDKEAIFFNSPYELVEKVNWLLKNNEERCKIAKRGYRRVKELRASVYNRMEQVLRVIEDEIIKEYVDRRT